MGLLFDIFYRHLPLPPKEFTMSEVAVKTMLEKQATEVALDLMPSEAAKPDSERSLDLINIISIVITILQKIVEVCPQSADLLATSAKAPSRLQRAFVMKQCRDGFDCCGNPQTRRWAGAAAESILVRASKSSSNDLAQLIKEARGFDNLLI